MRFAPFITTWVIAALLCLAPRIAPGQTPAQGQAQATGVDLQLVLAIDSSSSVDMDEYYLQLEGYAAAFRHPALLQAIQRGSHRAIAVTLFEWSGPRQQKVN